ncbi:hypothetical protein [Devosia sp.]|uniref:hypothetical protein n=1 Tax=Devosia sp. TaxID=1871048 RepID=UPI0027339EA5|nr:hypothetical protein [Devosia sp.]MDP2782000.1 hypothetical protein [Devosia sp.]
MSIDSNSAATMSSSAFLQGIHHAYAQVDGSYSWPNSREGDLLRAAKSEIEALRDAPDSGSVHKPTAAECVALPVEPSVALLTTMSAALGIDPLGDGSDGSYPITGAQSTVRQCYDALVRSLRQTS